MNHIQEPAQNIPVTAAYDVVVVGGGIAGVAAAVAATRNSARVCLLERFCGLGGLATLGNVTMWLPLCDGNGHQVIAGLGEELLRLSVADLQKNYPAAGFTGIPQCWKTKGALEERTKQRYRTGFNPAAYMLALEKTISASGVTLMYDTRFCAVRREESRVSHVIVENKDGRSALACRTVVDATGDADVCSAAGEPIVALDSNVAAGWFFTLMDGELQLHPMSNRYSPLARKKDAEGPFFSGDKAADVTSHILHTRENMRQRLKSLREKHPDHDVQPVMPPTMACFRMTRRLAGRFTLAEQHMHQWFDDTIGLTGDWRQAGPVYAIPFRCLQPGELTNLLVAGRCISVDNTAWDVLRAIPPCVVTGEAAGTAAALAVAKHQANITKLEYKELHDRLIEQRVLLDPSLVRRDSSDQIERNHYD